MKLFETIVFRQNKQELEALNAHYKYKAWNGAAEGHREILRKLRHQASRIE